MDNNQSMYDRERWCCEQCKRRCNGNFYTIKAGDTLYSISRMYNVPVAEITRANPYINVYNLRINDRICIPDRRMPQQPPMRPMPYPEMPDDYFEMNGGMNNNMGMQPVMPRQNMNMDGVNMSERTAANQRITLAEDDTIADLLKKTGVTLEWLIEHVNTGMM